MSPVTVRPVTPDEYGAVAELTVSVYGEILGDILSEEYAAELSAVAHRAQEASVLVALDEAGRLVGSVTYVPGPGGPYAEFEGDDEVGVRMLVVDRAAQRQGVGTALMAHCLARARAEGRARMSLHTTAQMAAARRFYEGLGFRRAPERDIQLPDVVLLAYVLELDAAGG